VKLWPPVVTPFWSCLKMKRNRSLGLEDVFSPESTYKSGLGFLNRVRAKLVSLNYGRLNPK
jgi:hypothetical protein